MNLKLSEEAMNELVERVGSALSNLNEDVDFISQIMDDNIVEYLMKDQDLTMMICPDDNGKKLNLYVHPVFVRKPAVIPLTKLFEIDLDPTAIADMYEYDVSKIEEKRVLLLKLLSKLSSAIDKAHKRAKTIQKRR